MNFELVGRGRPSTSVHQGITELREGRTEGKKEINISTVDALCLLEGCRKKDKFIPGRTFSAGDPSLRVY